MLEHFKNRQNLDEKNKKNLITVILKISKTDMANIFFDFSESDLLKINNVDALYKSIDKKFDIRKNEKFFLEKSIEQERIKIFVKNSKIKIVTSYYPFYGGREFDEITQTVFFDGDLFRNLTIKETIEVFSHCIAAERDCIIVNSNSASIFKNHIELKVKFLCSKITFLKKSEIKKFIDENGFKHLLKVSEDDFNRFFNLN